MASHRSVRAAAPVAEPRPTAGETPAEKRAREKRLLDQAQRRALSVEANRKVLAALAKR